MVGVALFYGDAIITPAISVLSAVEGLKLVPGLRAVRAAAQPCHPHRPVRGPEPWHGVGWRRFFGPITAFWFVVMALGGLGHLADDISILAAFNLAYGMSFLLNHGSGGLLALGPCSSP